MSRVSKQSSSIGLKKPTSLTLRKESSSKDDVKDIDFRAMNMNTSSRESFVGRMDSFIGNTSFKQSAVITEKVNEDGEGEGDGEGRETQMSIPLAQSRLEMQDNIEADLELLDGLILDEQWTNIPVPVRNTFEGLMEFTRRVSRTMVCNDLGINQKVDMCAFNL